MSMPTSAWGRVALLALAALTVTPAATAQTKRIYFDGTGLSLQQTIADELAAGEDDLTVYLKAPASGTQTYTGPISLAASQASIKIIGGYDTEPPPLPDAIVLQGGSSSPDACFGNVLRDPSFEGGSNGAASTAWTFSTPVGTIFNPTTAYANIINTVSEGFASLTPDVIDGRRAVLVQNGLGENTIDVSFTQTFRTPAGVAQPFEFRFGAFAISTDGLQPPPTVSIELSGGANFVSAPVPVLADGNYNPAVPIVIPALPPDQVVTFTVHVRNALLSASAQTKLVLDAFCLKPQIAPPIAATLDLNRPASDESISVVLENFTIAGGSYAVQAGPGVNLVVNRCYLTGSPAGLRVNQTGNDGTVVVAHSVFANTDAGIKVDEGGVAVYQSTFRGNGTGIQVNAAAPALSAVVASLFVENDADLVVSGGNGLRTAGNMYFSDYGTGAPAEPSGTTAVGSFGARPAPSIITDLNSELFLNNAWNGKLQEDVNKVLRAGFSYFELPAAVQGLFVQVAGDTDFEGGLRDLNDLEVGADETDSPAQAPWYWQNVSLAYSDGSLPNAAGGLLPAVGKNRALDITISLVGRNANEITNVFVVPELLLSDGPADPEARVRAAALDWGGTGAKALDVTTLTVTDTITLSLRPDGLGVAGNQAIVDGRATILIELDDTLYGIGFETSNVTSDAQANSQFIIDTLPPVISMANLSAGNLITSSNDVAAAPASSTDYPAQWAPQYGAVPSSFGTIDDRYRDPQAFFNYPISATDGLDFSVELPFTDFGPENVTITTAGFDPTFGISGAAIDVLFGPDDASPLPDGAARWVGARPVTELGASTANAGATVSGNSATFAWSVNDVIYDPSLAPNGWRIQARITAKDRAGNQATSDRPLILWWLTEALAQITSAPNGPTTTPTIVWSLARNVNPQNAEACVPVMRYKLWRAVNPAVPTSDWEELTGWSDWTDRPTITGSSRLYFNSPLRVGDVLATQAPGERIGISVMGADEAGNVEGSVNSAVYNGALFNESDLLITEPLSFASWETGEAKASLDTRIQARFWQNRTDTPGSLLYSIQPESELDFGSNPRIPLPADPADPIRVEAKFDVDISNGLGFQWELYEDGRLAASGAMVTEAGSASLQFPQDLIVVPSGLTIDRLEPFLNAGCGLNFFDRLGDEGCDDGNFRRRDVTYTFVARAAADSGGTTVYDPSPATINFTVYVDLPAEDEQPVKESSRGGN